jgi:hypothetical protein
MTVLVSAAMDQDAKDPYELQAATSSRSKHEPNEDSMGVE